jgi:hypothetical protein
MANKIPLSEVLGNISEELLKAHQNAQKRGFATMNFNECEIEFAIEAEKSGSGGVQVWVLELGGEIKKSEANTIRVKFTANPQQSFSAPARIPGPAPKPARQSRRRSNP